MDFVSTEDLERTLTRKDLPVIESWMDFQGRYGGYVEHLGHDEAIWGVIHKASTWQDPLDVLVERDGDEYLIACADVHPSYDYWLTSTGEFTGLGGGGPCVSFDKKVEQSALVWSLKGTIKRIMDFDSWSVQSKDQLLRDVSRGFVPEASDKYTRCWLTESWLVFQRRRGCTVRRRT